MSSADNKMPTAANKESLLWWRHPFNRMRWSRWHINWRELENRIPASREKSPTGVLRRLKEARCDPDVALRLAFLESSHKPATQSELAKDNKRQQDIKRKLRQSRDHLRSAAFGLIEATLPEIAKGRKKVVQRMLVQSQNHISKAAAALKSALSVAPLIFVRPEDIDSLRTLADVTGPQNVAPWVRLQDFARMCDHELEVLLWPRAVELHSGQSQQNPYGGGASILRRFQKAHVSSYFLIVSFGQAPHAVQWGEKRPSRLGQRILDASNLRFDFFPVDQSCGFEFAKGSRKHPL